MLKKMGQKSAYIFICLLLTAPYSGRTAAPPENVPAKSLDRKASQDPKSPWNNLNIFAQMTGIWTKPAKKMEIRGKNPPSLSWHSEQGGELNLFFIKREPLGSAQGASLRISGDFFSCSGDSLKLWFTNQKYILLSHPVCDDKNMLTQDVPKDEEEKFAAIMNEGGFPVLVSQGNLAIVIRSQLLPQEVQAMSWYRFITNPKFNKDFVEKNK